MTDEKSIKNRMAKIKAKVHKMIKQKKYVEAEKGIKSYIKVMPEDPEGYTLWAKIYRANGKLDAALKILEEGYKNIPRSYEILYNLSEVYHEKKRNLSALNFLREAEFCAETEEHEKKFKKLLSNIKKYIKTKKIYRDDGYRILAQGDPKKSLAAFNFKMGEMKRRISLLEVITEKLSDRKKRIINIPVEYGIITRNLRHYGYKSIGFDENKDNIHRAMVFEIEETYRHKKYLEMTRFFYRPLTLENFKRLENDDVIVFAPQSLGFFDKMENREEKIEVLLQNCGQLFINVPAAQKIEKAEEEIAEEKSAKIKGKILEEEDEYLEEENLDMTVEDKLANKNEEKMERMRDDLLKNVHEIAYNLNKNLLEIHENNSDKLLYIGEDRLKDTSTISVPRGIKSIKSDSEIIKIDTDKCTDFVATNYGNEGWNNYRAVIEEHIEKGDKITYGTSVLRDYYNKFMPKNMNQFLFFNDEENFEPINLGWVPLPWLKVNMPKEKIPKKYSSKRKKKTGGIQHFGPNNKDFLKREYNRILKAYNKIKSMGYVPEAYPDGFIQGYFFMKGGDYTFYVTEGKHRLAAMAALGIERFKCRLESRKKRYLMFVDYEEVENWPQVKRGLYSKEAARKVFMQYFNCNGSNIAEEYDLYNY